MIYFGTTRIEKSSALPIPNNSTPIKTQHTLFGIPADVCSKFVPEYLGARRTKVYKMIKSDPSRSQMSKSVFNLGEMCLKGMPILP